jgi:hypothetical protein
MNTETNMLKQRCIGSILVVATCLTGCAKAPAPLPKTYPVHGKVTYRDGAPVNAGMVQLQPEADTSVTTKGEIGRDGTYSLTTMRDGLRAEGAVAGPNRVTVFPSDIVKGAAGAADHFAPGLPSVLPTPFNVQQRDNALNLTAERKTGSARPAPVTP